MKQKKQNNQDAQNFIKWWRQEKQSIESTSVGSVLTQRRDHNVHRKTQSPDLINIQITENIGISESVSVKVFPANMTAEEALKITREESEREQKLSNEQKDKESAKNTSSSKVDLHFKELPSHNVLQACTELFNMMKQFVNKASTLFPCP